MALSFKDNPFSRKKDSAPIGVPEAPLLDTTKPETPGRPALKPGMAEYIAGETREFKIALKPYLPNDLMGGSLPHIPGMEDEAVWNAASQACATEKVHYCYSVDQGRLWYLACPSSSLASNPDSWCPLAAALPGNSEYWDRQTVYIYEQEGMASALRWDPETGRMQVFLGAARTLLPRIQSMDANFVTINPEVAQTISWRNRALRSEMLSRGAARSLLYFGLLLNVLIFSILIFSYISLNFVKRDLDSVKTQTENASMQLMMNAANALQSDAIKHMVRIQDLLDSLGTIDGTLVRYEVNKGKVEWEALVPPSFQSGVGTIKGQVVTETVPAQGQSNEQGIGKAMVQPKLEKDGRVRLKGTN